MSDTEERLNAFAPVSKSEWLAKVEADLKGQPFSKLRSTTPGGLVIEPLYAPEDAKDSSRNGLPGAYPFVRGSAPLAGWVIQQEYDDPRPSVCKDQIQRDVERGAGGIWLRVGPRRGCRIVAIEELDQLLGSVDLAHHSICIDGGPDALAVAAAFLAVAKRRSVAFDALRGSLCVDPVGLLAADGRVEGGLAFGFEQMRDLACWCAEHAPNLRTAHVSSDPYASGGASATQEIAYTIATGIEYLRRLTGAGVPVDVAARQIGFSYSMTDDFFLQIAKLRAARRLWAKVVVTAGAEAASAAMPIHARTSRFTKTQRDPWVNMLRVTAECTAAILGGARSIATLPFDCAVGPASELAQRVARNTQIVLQEESHLDAVLDPAGGSWFVERVTDDLAGAAWEEIRAIEAQGGIVEALGSGTVLDAIREVAQSRRRDIGTRKTPIVGVSEFANLEETELERDSVGSDETQRALQESLAALEPAAYRNELVAIARAVKDTQREPTALTRACLDATTTGADMYSVASVLSHGQPDFFVEPIPRWRAAEPWEQLRDRADRISESPKAFLANLGAIPSHKVRSGWAQNLLAAAGIGAVTNDGFDDMHALAQAWKEASVPIAVICGSDRDYETMLESAVSALKTAGCPVLLVAGRPGAREQALREAGVSDFLFMGADVLSIMGRVLDSIEVPQ